MTRNNLKNTGIERRKVFISFLGTNDYVSTYYHYGKNKSPKPVRFIQEALIGMFCSDWTANDHIYIFRTKKARDLNWVNFGQEYNKTAIGLETTLENMHLVVPYEEKEIPEGFSEEELWGIFNSIFECILENDDLYVDVTHAFRSIPMFSTILFNYTKMIKSTETKAIYYGAFEIMGTKKEVLAIPEEERDAPILDLSKFVYLQNITNAANNFVNSGNLRSTAEILKQIEFNLESGKKSISHKDKLSYALSSFSDELDTCRGTIIKSGKTVKTIKAQIGNMLKYDIPSPIEEVLRRILEKMNKFKDESDLDNVVEAVWWCSKNGMMQQAYTLAEEYIITIVTDILLSTTKISSLIQADDEKKKKKDEREFCSSVIGMNDLQVQDPNNWFGIIRKEEYKDSVLQILDFPWIKELRKPYGKLLANRNDLNHGGFLDNKTPDVFIKDKNFKQPFETCLEILAEEKKRNGI